MFVNKLKKDLYAGKTCFGTFMSLNSTDVVECGGLAGFDFVIIDTEHGYMSPETTMNLVRAAELSGTTPITRATENGETTILRCLDVGAHGIQVPQVNTKEEAELAVRRAKYYPEGLRGAALTRSGNYGLVSNIADYFKHENAETLVSVHIENVVGLKNVEEIAATPGVDVLFLGPFDMSQSMGIPGQLDSPQIQEAADKVLAACKKYGKIPGIYAEFPEQAKLRAAQGFKYIPIGMVTSLISRGFVDLLKKVKGEE
ncbi:MAG: aldolase [Clostridiales bacterium]|nr:aldolase [Clostridiales bacterium]